MKVRTLLMVGVATVAGTMAAQAQPISGPYVAAGAGANWRSSQGLSGTFFPLECGSHCGNAIQGQNIRGIPFHGADANFDVGVGALGSVGWGFGNGLRLEVEGNYRNSGLHSVSGGGFSVPMQGSVNTYGVMANALFDLDVGLPWLYPYLGGGLGYAWSSLDGVHPSCCSGVNAGGSGGGFAYQAIAGLGFPIAAVRGLSVTLEYRFFGAEGTQQYRVNHLGVVPVNGVRNAAVGAPGTAVVNVGAQANNAVMLGVRYAFNVAPAAVMAAPAPVAPAAKSFLVFFDWDKATLTDRARGIIGEAAAASKSTAHTTIEVNGYADTSGNPHYNQGLSMRRAQAVAAELVRDGVAKQEIAIKAFGDTVLLVPTGPGVREPQNRRVEIIIRCGSLPCTGLREGRQAAPISA